MDDSDKTYLPQHILDQLSNRVCRRIEYLKLLDFNKHWKEVALYAEEIDRKPDHLDSVILSCRGKHYTLFSHSTSPRWYNVKLTLTFILLYFQHRNDELYQKAIFPVLYDHMGYFGGGSTRTELIKLTDGVIEFNQLLNSQINKKTTAVAFCAPEDQRRFNEIKEKIEKASGVEKDAKINELLKENAALREQLSKLQEGGKEASEDDSEEDALNTLLPHDKVRLDVLLKLMEKDGLILEKYGNKTKAAKLMHKLSGLPLSTCKNYCTNRDMNVSTHREEILEINTLLHDLEMSLHL
ncbi:MAG: hypothetical protein J6O23_01855 [Prevotella sp.]|nr:hypothetical protein [Prevotella sp.]